MDESKYPNCTGKQIELVKKYGHLLNNTGGNPPLELLDDYNNPKNHTMAKTNLPRFVLAACVASQLHLLESLQGQGLLS